MLNIQNVCKRFGEKEVLRDLSLELPGGSVLGLVGVNGAGKSTLLRLIAGVYAPEGGSILLDGRDTYRDPEVRRRIAFVADELYAPVGTTIASMRVLYENMYPFDAKAFERYCGLFDLAPSMTVANLSKGMKRRVSLLFALSVHPSLLLLDEAYDGLEPLARLQFRRILAERVGEEHIGVILSGHSLKEMEDICDSFAILHEGRILDSGDLADATARIGRYQLAFDREPEREEFDGLDVLRFEREGRVCRMVIRGDAGETERALRERGPILLDRLPANFEEMFLYELESREEKHV